MPIIDAGFTGQDGKPDHAFLIAYGPSINVTVGHITDDVKGADDQIIAPASVFALIDSGACESCIDVALAQKLQLPVVDVQTVAGVGGAAQHDVFMAKVVIPTLGFHQHGRFTGVKLTDGGQTHEVLLGRTFLRNVIMIYDGIRGQITITSHIP